MTNSKYWVSRNIVTVHEWAVGDKIRKNKNNWKSCKIHIALPVMVKLLGIIRVQISLCINIKLMI